MGGVASGVGKGAGSVYRFLSHSVDLNTTDVVDASFASHFEFLLKM